MNVISIWYFDVTEHCTLHFYATQKSWLFFCGKSYVVYVQKTSIFVTFWFRRATETPRVTQSLHRRKQNKRRVNSSLETNLAAFKCGRCKGSCGGSCWVKRTALVLQASENNSVWADKCHEGGKINWCLRTGKLVPSCGQSRELHAQLESRDDSRFVFWRRCGWL